MFRAMIADESVRDSDLSIKREQAIAMGWIKPAKRVLPGDPTPEPTVPREGPCLRLDHAGRVEAARVIGQGPRRVFSPTE